MSQGPIDVRPVHRGVTPRTPACTTAHKRGVRHVAYEQVSAHGVHLRVALEAKVVVPLQEHLVGDRTMRVMADRAAFAQRFMLVNDRSRLFAMALRARLVEPRQSRLRPHAERSPMRCLEDVRPVWIVALHASPPLLEHGMMVRKTELRVHLHMTLEAGRRLPARIDD